jgi:SAM-dependent methyltransferase
MREGGLSTFSSAMEDARRYHSWILARFGGFVGDSVLEAGFGHGSFRSQLGSRVRYIGIDSDPKIVADARREFPDDLFLEADIGDGMLLEMLGSTRVNTVLCVNVLEHVEDDRRAIRNLLGALEVGGHLLLFVPAFQANFNVLDRLAGHRRRYTRKEVAALVPPELGVLKRNDYFNPIGALGWFLNGFLHYDSLEGRSIRSQVRFFDTFVTPFSRLLDPATRTLFGQSVVSIVERR